MQKISKNMPVAYDLSPSEQYFNAKGSYIKVFDVFALRVHPDIKNLNFEEANDFLFDEGRELNAQALINAHNLHTADFDNYDLRTAGVNLYAIDGCKAGTIGKFVEAHNHGIIGESINYLAPEETPGDGTVPLESSTNLLIDQGNKFYALKGEHGKLLSADGIRQQIVNIISGSTLATQDVITQDISKCELKGQAISIYSPLSIDITDQGGNHSGFSSDGVSTENNIPNADFEIIGEHKFVYLPTDEGQTYTINVSGTGAGTFTLTDASINANNITGMQVFKNIAVTPSLFGHLNIADNTTLSLDTNGDGVIDQTLSPNAVLNADDAQNFVPDFEGADNNSKNNTTVAHSSSGGGSYSHIVSSAVVTAEDPKVKSENNPKIVIPKQKTEIMQTPQVQNPQKENTLTANAVDTGVQVNYKILIIVFSGMLLILLVAKNFIKV
jgi:hypothetical protein